VYRSLTYFPVSLASFDSATITAIPASVKVFVMAARGSTAPLKEAGPIPRDILTISTPSSYAFDIPVMIVSLPACPLQSKTRYMQMDASGATPVMSKLPGTLSIPIIPEIPAGFF
jgi:hypothetical protein